MTQEEKAKAYDEALEWKELKGGGKMKALDKIYIDADLIKFHLLDEHLNDSEVEYIRKDALLEWAKKNKKETEDVLKEYPKDDSAWAEMHWWEDVIDKINSL